jgi:hypothetical protein
MGAFGFFDAGSDYSRTSITPDSTPAPGPSFDQLFKPDPRTRRPMRATTAATQGRLAAQLSGGPSVGIPDSVKSRASVAPTPTMDRPRAPKTSGKGQGKAKVQETIREE